MDGRGSWWNGEQERDEERGGARLVSEVYTSTDKGNWLVIKERWSDDVRTSMVPGIILVMAAADA